MINDNIFEFIKSRIDKLAKLGVDISNLELDHFGYQTSSKEDYEKTREDSKNIGELLSENIVNGRRVAIYELKCPIQYNSYLLSGFEVIEPMEGQTCKSELNHFEFVLTEKFEDFVKRYPNVNWNTTAMNRPEFPKVSYIFEDGTNIKFHPQNILKEIPKA